MKSLKEYIGKENPKIKDFVGNLFNARQKTHILHLQSKSYAEHMALDGFYNDILSLIDNFIETYQGEYGIINNYPKLESKEESAIDYLEEFAKVLKESHVSIAEGDSHLDNIVDEMTALTYKTLYKLKNLK